MGDGTREDLRELFGMVYSLYERAEFDVAVEAVNASLLLAMLGSDDAARGVRISIGETTTDEDGRRRGRLPHGGYALTQW